VIKMGAYAVQLPKRVVFGIEAEVKIGAEAKGLGATKALVVSDVRIEKAGLLDTVEKTLKEVVEVDIFDKVEPEPTLASAETVANVARAANYDLIVGVGGGSVMDMAKVASAAVSNPDQDISEFFGGNKIVKPSVSKILVPTTAGTGAEATPFALVVVEGKKKAIASPYNIADVVLISPSFTATMPPEITASTGMDALSHAIEAFLSLGANPLTDSFALDAVGKIVENLELAFLDSDNLDARLKMSLAALLAGIAFGNAGVIAGHASAHAFGAKYKIPHGISAALALPYIMEYNAPASEEKLARVAREMGVDIAGLTIEEAASNAAARVKNLLRKLELPTRLSDLKVPKDDLPELAEAMSKDKGYLARNPRKIELEDAVLIFEQMWSGE
jgi:alcohol dehydrogenase class IV